MTRKEKAVSDILGRLDTSQLLEFSDESLSISDISTALHEAYESGMLQIIQEKAEQESQEPHVVLMAGNGVMLKHRNGSMIIGTVMPEGGISHPAGYHELVDLGVMGWMLIHIMPPEGAQEEED